MRSKSSLRTVIAAHCGRRFDCLPQPTHAARRSRTRRPRGGAAPAGAKAPTRTPSGPDGTTAIMWAASNDDVELVRALIKAGANVKVKNQFGTSALTEAAIIGSASIINALIKAGADPNTKNPEGETPLMAAARSGKVEAAKVLLEAGADVNAKEDVGRTDGADVGRRAEPTRDGEVPRDARRRPQRARHRAQLGAQGHHRAASEGHESGRLHSAAVRRARRMRRVRASTSSPPAPIRISKTRIASRRSTWRS